VLDAARVAKRLHVPAGALSVERTLSGRVDFVRVGARRIDAGTFRTTLGLASTWFDVGELSLTANHPQVRFGAKLELAARADGLGTALLQRRIGAGRWKTLERVGGAERVTVEPQGRTLYRLSAGGVHGPVVGVAVVPQLDVTPTAAQLLTGSVSPISRGTVTVWRKVAGGWKVVAHPQIDVSGVFRAPLRLHPGGYRVTVAETARFAPVTSTLHVTPRLLASLSH
jgi:hypothetical protein